MERKQIQLTPQQMAALRREAANAERVRRALSVVGKFSSGGGCNIATEHDRELGDILYEEVRAKG